MKDTVQIHMQEGAIFGGHWNEEECKICAEALFKKIQGFLLIFSTLCVTMGTYSNIFEVIL